MTAETTDAGPTSRAAPAIPATTPSRARWAAALLVGLVLFVVALVIAHAFPSAVLGLRLEGAVYGLVGLLFAPLALAAVAAGLRVARARLRDAGVTFERFGADAVIGAAVGVAWALLQFGLLIPATGGAERADVVVNAEQIGPSAAGLAAFILLAWTGGFAEELFFRSHLVTTLRGVLGTGRGASIGVVAVPTMLFALAHNYQGGWVGMLDTAAFGGLALTLLFLWRGRLTATVFAHATWNTIAAAVIFLWY